MQLFYSKDVLSSSSLDSNESKHCISVLRKNINDIIYVTDGNGCLYKCTIESFEKKIVKLKIIEKEKKNQNKNIQLAVAFPKKRNRIEWMLEKITEIGVNEIHPIICNNSERKKINFERCAKILISSMKQSFNTCLPKIHEIQTFTKFVKSNRCKKKYIAHCDRSDNRKMIELEKEKNICIMIGPEGDFSDKEITLAKENNFIAIKLSENRLRTETAAIVACYKLIL